MPRSEYAKQVVLRVAILCVLTGTLMAWAFTVHLPQYLWVLF